jgi:hypothetical protein
MREVRRLAKIAVIDVGEWQNSLDFRTGRKLKPVPQGPRLQALQKLLRSHPYPGDLSPNSLAWVSQLGLDLIRQFDPRFVFLSYATPFFLSAFAPPDSYNWQEVARQTLQQAQDFARKSGFTPVIVGTGSTRPLEGEIDLTLLDGLAVGGGMGTCYAGLYQPSSQDLQLLADDVRVERIVSRREIEEQWPCHPDFARRLPDYLLAARPGFQFRGMGNMSRRLYRISSQDVVIPVLSPRPVDDISLIAPLVREMLKKERVALIILEGLGSEDFPSRQQLVGNQFSWYTYSPSDAQYLTITSGVHLPGQAYPPGNRVYDEDGAGKPYPFSGIHQVMPTGVIGADSGLESVAVGSRSILTHLGSGARVCVECFARTLYNYGIMGIIEE